MRFFLLILALTAAVAAEAQGFDHQHGAWTTLLQKHVAEVFKWYSIDLTSGLKGINSREQFFAKYADTLTDHPEQQKIIRDQKAELRFLDYDWALNDARR